MIIKITFLKLKSHHKNLLIISRCHISEFLIGHLKLNQNNQICCACNEHLEINMKFLSKFAETSFHFNFKYLLSPIAEDQYLKIHLLIL